MRWLAVYVGYRAPTRGKVLPGSDRRDVHMLVAVLMLAANKWVVNSRLVMPESGSSGGF